MMTKQAERNAIKNTREMQARVARDRQQLIDLLVNLRDNQPKAADISHLQAALERLEGVSAALTSFLQSDLGRQWEGA